MLGPWRDSDGLSVSTRWWWGAGSLLCQDPNHGVTEGKQETLGRDGGRQAAAGTEASLPSKHLSVMSWRKGVLNQDAGWRLWNTVAVVGFGETEGCSLEVDSRQDYRWDGTARWWWAPYCRGGWTWCPWVSSFSMFLSVTHCKTYFSTWWLIARPGPNICRAWAGGQVGI